MKKSEFTEDQKKEILEFALMFITWKICEHCGKLFPENLYTHCHHCGKPNYSHSHWDY